MYVVIDVETTGRDAEKYQVLQLAAVAWTNDDVNKCDYFDVLVNPMLGGGDGGPYGDGIVGDPYALHLNSWILEKLKDGCGVSALAASDYIAPWLSKFDVGSLHKGFINAAGVNFGNFDWQFLKRMPYFPTEFFSYRHVEIASMYATRQGPISLSEKFVELAKRHNIQGEQHNALFDARCELAALMEKLN